MGRGFRLFSVFGFEVRVDYSWLIIFFLILWTFTFGVFPQGLPGRAPATYVLMGFAGTLLFFGSIVAHELSHSLVARRRGIRVEGITLFIFGGMAHTRMEMENPGDEFRIAAVGPLTSVAIGVLLLLIAGLLGATPVGSVARYVGSVNLALAAFNLLPGFPLDGGRIFRAAVWRATGNLAKATRWASTAGKALGYGLIAAGVLSFFAGSGFGGLWLVFIGWFVRTAAESSYLELILRRSLHEMVARDVMTPEPSVVPPEMPLQAFVEEKVLHGRHQSYPVVDDGRPVGVITLEGVRQVPRELWPERTVRDAMVPAERVRVEPGERMDKVVEQLAASPARRVLVIERGELAGIITQHDVARLIERWRMLDSLGERAA